jgi:hypothetical protein
VAYQTPYTTSPYGPNIPSSASPQAQLPANYIMPGGMPQYQMNPAAMPTPAQQQMMQRMHPPQQNVAAMSPQRPFNPQGTPTNMPTPQFPNPQQQGAPQAQPPNIAQPPVNSVTTPQTPTFPSSGPPPHINGVSSIVPPLSPGTESREKERFTLLLDINQELLFESIQIQNSRQEIKKALGTGGNKEEYEEQDKIALADYNQ